MRNIFLLISLLIFSSFAYAYPQSYAYPRSYAHPRSYAYLNCPAYDVKESKDNYVLNANSKEKNSQIYFIKNISRNTVLLNHPVKNPGASAGFSSELDSRHWSAILVATPNFNMSCHIVEKDKFREGECRNLISMCQMKNPASRLSAGNYWLAENKSWRELRGTLAERGVRLSGREY